MGLFDDIKGDKAEKYLEKYHLENIDANDLKMIEEITKELTGAGLLKAGIALSFGKAEEQAKIGLLSVLVKQNWIMIRKLDEISRKLDK